MSDEKKTVFNLPNGKIIPAGPVLRSRGNVLAIKSINGQHGLRITPNTSVPQWHGEHMDHGTAVDMLLGCE